MTSDADAAVRKVRRSLTGDAAGASACSDASIARLLDVRTSNLGFSLGRSIVVLPPLELPRCDAEPAVRFVSCSPLRLVPARSDAAAPGTTAPGLRFASFTGLVGFSTIVILRLL